MDVDHAGFTDPTRGESEAGRFWAMTNVSEAVSDILTPLCWSIWGIGMYRARSIGYGGLGLMTREVVPPRSNNDLSNAVFYGRLALNVDLNRAMYAALPGMSDEDFERSTTGAVRSGLVPTKKRLGRLPAVVARGTVTVATQARVMQARHDEELAWWRETALAGRCPGSAEELLAEAGARFERTIGLHLRSRFLQIFFQGRLRKLAARHDRADAVLGVLGGLGGVTEVELADDLWSVGHGTLELSEFLRRHGFHGPNEGNVCTTSWREDPAPVEALARVMGQQGDDDRPIRREARAGSARRAAVHELLVHLPGRHRRLARFHLARIGSLTRAGELGKAAFVIDLDVYRFAARSIGDRLVAEGVLADREDVFFLTAEELLGERPGDPRGLVAFRRAQREGHRALELPKTFTGMPIPTAPVEASARRSGSVVGVGASPGSVEGRVAVVLDPADVAGYESGSILVCRTTDPSWAPLLALSDAVVVDIGSVVSHGAITARELGIPCVMGTTVGTKELATGDLVRVDGTSGEVTVLARAGATSMLVEEA